jgi:hypothetical protein
MVHRRHQNGHRQRVDSDAERESEANDYPQLSEDFRAVVNCINRIVGAEEGKYKTPYRLRGQDTSLCAIASDAKPS